MNTRLLAVEVDRKPESFKTVTTGRDVELFNKQPINVQKPVTVKRNSPGSLPVISSPNNDDNTFSTASRIECVQPTGHTNQSQISFSPASVGPSNLILTEAQQESGDVATIYAAVKDQKDVAPETLSVSSSELKKLSSMTSLMHIRDDGVLVVSVLVGKRRRQVIICPRSMRKDVIWDTHILSHSGITKSCKRLRLTWYWPGMIADIRRLIKTCETCQKAKQGGLHQYSSNGPFVVKKVFGNGTYKVQGRGTVHECRLKLFITSDDPRAQLSQSPQLADPSSDSELINDPIQNSQQYLDRSPGNYATGRSRRRRGRPSRLDD